MCGPLGVLAIHLFWYFLYKNISTQTSLAYLFYKNLICSNMNAENRSALNEFLFREEQ